MIPKLLHQVFFPFEAHIKSVSDITVFGIRTHNTKNWCDKNEIKYKMWNLEDCKELIKKYQFEEIWYDFPQSVMRVDFIRYLILYDQGGIYLDCDVEPIRSMDQLWTKNAFFARWYGDKNKTPYIAVCGSSPKNEIFMDIINHSIESYMEKKHMKFYETATGRFVFQVTGHFCVKRVLKKNPNKVELLPIVSVINRQKEIYDFPPTDGDLPAIFYDENISSWYEKKHIKKNVDIIINE